MHVLYVTKRLPFGDEETFVVPEIEQHRNAGYKVTICPVQCGRLVHSTGKKLMPITLAQPLLSLKIIAALLLAMLTSPCKLLAVLFDLLRSRPRRVLLRNLVVFPKGVWLGCKARKLNVDHIHAHWIAVPSTMAMIASRISGIPFSITAHRYDIGQKNLLPSKFAYAKFVRAIDVRGASELTAAVPEPINNLVVVHMGVSFPSNPMQQTRNNDGMLRVVCAAHYLEKKGHQYLLQAIAKVRDADCRVHAELCGSGPLETKLKELCVSLKLTDQVQWPGVVSHEELLGKFSSGCYDAAVLPSITTADGAKEGIPVFLMEAMAAGLPVVTTANGGITELVGPDRGVIVAERDVAQLADALLALAHSPELRNRLGSNGRKWVEAEFEAHACAAKIRKLIES